MNNMEIKQGDKVRVSKDIPMFYRRYNSYRVFEVEHQVVDIEDGLALLDSIPPKFTTILPTKYLVKVDAEAKEAKFKVGDIAFYVCSLTIKHKCTVTKVMQNEHSGKWEYNVLYDWGKPGMWIPESDLEPYTEPTEQTEAEKNPCDGISEETANEISNMLEAYHNALSGIADSFDWQRYEADLAKEVALKVSYKYRDAKEAAEYAVSVAKAVVEGLKRK